MPPYKDKRVRSLSWFFRTSIPTGISENIGDFVLGLFRGRKLHQSISLPGLHTVTFSVPSSSQRAVSSDANVVCGFVRGRSVIAENAVTDWLPGPDTGEIKFEWNQYMGVKKNDLIISFSQHFLAA